MDKECVDIENEVASTITKLEDTSCISSTCVSWSRRLALTCFQATTRDLLRGRGRERLGGGKLRRLSSRPVGEEPGTPGSEVKTPVAYPVAISFSSKLRHEYRSPR